MSPFDIKEAIHRFRTGGWKKYGNEQADLLRKVGEYLDENSGGEMIEVVGLADKFDLGSLTFALHQGRHLKFLGVISKGRDQYRRADLIQYRRADLKVMVERGVVLWSSPVDRGPGRWIQIGPKTLSNETLRRVVIALGIDLYTMVFISKMNLIRKLYPGPRHEEALRGFGYYEGGILADELNLEPRYVPEGHRFDAGAASAYSLTEVQNLALRDSGGGVVDVEGVRVVPIVGLWGTVVAVWFPLERDGVVGRNGWSNTWRIANEYGGKDSAGVVHVVGHGAEQEGAGMLAVDSATGKEVVVDAKYMARVLQSRDFPGGPPWERPNVVKWVYGNDKPAVPGALSQVAELRALRWKSAGFWVEGERESKVINGVELGGDRPSV